jgi:UDP-N-acetylmuramate: L-alanyl-gamma-D-glutamyl-meso-diaminopimelate ligase
VPAGGLLVTEAEDANIADLLQREAVYLKSAGRRVVTYGLERGDYRAVSIRIGDKGSTIFEIVRAGKANQAIEMQLIGDYNVKNALACFALLESLGFEAERIAAAIGTFQGVKRRQEIIGRPNDITVIEDFAHHPTAVKQTIDTVQKHYPNSRVFSIFEPRSATSRRSVFQKEYAEALGRGHAVLFPPPFDQSMIAVEQRFSTERLLTDLRARGIEADVFATVDDIVSSLKLRTRPGDVVLVMSNGAFGGIYTKLLKVLA